MTSGPRPVSRSVLARGLAVLGSFSNERREQTLGEIQRATGLPSATTFRLVSELVEWGGLERIGRGRYRVGIRMWQVGSLAPGPRELRDVALPYLQDLLDVTHEVVHLVVRDGTRGLYLERLMSRPEVRVRSRVARRLPLYATGPGKVLLAYATDGLVDEVVAEGLRRMAARTITDPAELRRALDTVRATGYCLSRDEMTDGASSVAVPVRCATGEVIAAISVVVPSTTPLERLVPVVRLAAAGISRGMRPLADPRA